MRDPRVTRQAVNDQLVAVLDAQDSYDAALRRFGRILVKFDKRAAKANAFDNEDDYEQLSTYARLRQEHPAVAFAYGQVEHWRDVVLVRTAVLEAMRSAMEMTVPASPTRAPLARASV